MLCLSGFELYFRWVCWVPLDNISEYNETFLLPMFLKNETVLREHQLEQSRIKVSA